MNTKIIGDTGEKAAVKYLIKNKFKILETNFRSPFGEIDIIAEYKKELHFIEVKTRSSNKFGTGKEAVNALKQSKIIKTAQYYICENDLNDINCIFDVADVFICDGKYNIELVQNAFCE